MPGLGDIWYWQHSVYCPRLTLCKYSYLVHDIYWISHCTFVLSGIVRTIGDHRCFCHSRALSLLTLTRLVTTVKPCHLNFGIFDMNFPANVLVSILTGDNSNDNHAGISCGDTISSPSKKSSPSSNDKNAAPSARKAGVTRAAVVSCHLSISSS